MAGEIAGYKADLMFSTSTSGSVTKLAGLTNFSINLANDPIDVTTFDSSGAREFVYGLDGWDGTAEVAMVTTNATHKNFVDMLLGRLKGNIEFFPSGSSSDGYYSGSVLMTGWNLSAPMEDKLGLSVAFRGTGVLARTSSST